MDPTLVVLLSFVIFMGLAYRLGYRKALNALDDKIEGISESLAQASQAKEAALQALNEERGHQEEKAAEISLILQEAEKQVSGLQQKTLRDIDGLVKKRRSETQDLLKRLHTEAIQEIQQEVIRGTIETLETLIITQFSQSQHQAFNDQAIEQVIAQLGKKDTPDSPLLRPVRKKRMAME